MLIKVENMEEEFFLCEKCKATSSSECTCIDSELPKVITSKQESYVCNECRVKSWSECTCFDSDD